MTEEQARVQTNDPISQAIGQIDRVAAAIMPTLGWWSSGWPSEFVQVEEIVDSFLTQRIKTAGDRTKLMEVVKARRDKLSLSSGITTPIIGICQQILAFGGAGVALTIGFIDKVRHFDPVIQKVLAVVGIFYAELIVLSLVVLLIYMLQARFRYPSIYFERIGNAWPFFYYASITPVSRNPLQGSRTRFEASVNYAKDLVRFSDKVLSENEEDRCRAELQQYFLLVSYQAYVHQFAVRLAALFMYGFIAAVATALVMFGLIFGGVL